MPKQMQRRRTSSTKGRGRKRRLPKRTANGRFVKARRVQSRPRRAAARPRRATKRPRRATKRPRRATTRPKRVRRVRTVRRYQRLARMGIVREASDRSVAGPGLVKRRWYRIDGPVDPSLPEGYANPR